MRLVAYKRGSRELPHPFHRVRTRQEAASYEPGRRPSPEHDHAGALILEFPTTMTVRNKFLLFISRGVCGTFLQQPKQTKTSLRWCSSSSTVPHNLKT